MKIAITPSMQFHNQYICSGDVEGNVMGILGQKVVGRLNKYGAPSIQAQRFWSTTEDAWVGIADGAAAWGDYVIAFHTDSAGDARGYTGSLLCYGDNQEGHRLGTIIQTRMLTDFGWPSNGGRDYQDKLYMMGLGTPSCLLEIANHSDPDDCAFILGNLDKFADSIAWGIFEFLGINPRKDTQEDDYMKFQLQKDKNGIAHSYYQKGEFILAQPTKPNQDVHVLNQNGAPIWEQKIPPTGQWIELGFSTPISITSTDPDITYTQMDKR